MIKLNKFLAFVVFGLVIGRSFPVASAVETGATTEPKQTANVQWVRVPISVFPMERVMVRDYKGSTSDSYVSHPATTKVLRVRAGQANELYFGPWRFQVDASRMTRFGEIDLSVRLSHVNEMVPDSYIDLGQRILSGKAYKDGSTMLFVSQSKARFESDGSKIIADVEFGMIDEELQRSLSAAELVSGLAPKPKTTY